MSELLRAAPGGEFLPVLPMNSGFAASADRAKIGRRPPHCHSIVSGTYKHLKVQEFLSGYGAFTVTSTAKTFRLRAIDGDRSQRIATGKRISRRSHRIWAQF
jgi:hypothetical protein